MPQRSLRMRRALALARYTFWEDISFYVLCTSELFFRRVREFEERVSNIIPMSVFKKLSAGQKAIEDIACVRRQGIRDNRAFDLKEALAHQAYN